MGEKGPGAVILDAGALIKISLGLLLVPILCSPAIPALAAAAAPRVSVEVVLPGENSADAKASAQLKDRLIARLRQEGFIVVASDQETEVGLRLSFHDPGWLVRATLRAETLEREVTDCGILRGEDQLEIIQKATELVRRAHVRAAAVEPVSVPPSRTEVVAIQAVPPPAATSSLSEPSALEGSAGIDLLIRGDHVDPVARVGGRLALGSHLGLHLTTGLSGSRDGPLDVVESQTLVGLGYRLSARRHLSGEAALAGGFLLHHYATSLDSGNRVDPLALVILTGGVQLSRHIGLALRIAPGLSRTEFIQIVGDEVVWSRSRFRVETGITVVFH